MHDYQPLNLTQFCNVGTEFIREGAQPLIGNQTWHGLPFTVGSTKPDPARCFIGFGEHAGAGAAVTIPVGAAARYVIFAHALLESRVREGESIGHVVASKAEVDAVLARAVAAGATRTDETHKRPWGIYSGYFRDLDGHLWEIIWNPRLDV